jgi:hypothetical protein
VRRVWTKCRLLHAEIVSDDPDLFLMANLAQPRTGLPFIIWIGVNGGTEYQCRVGVSRTPTGSGTDMAWVEIDPGVRVVHGTLTPEEIRSLTKWVELNRDVLLAHWNGDLPYTLEAIEALRPIARTPTE